MLIYFIIYLIQLYLISYYQFHMPYHIYTQSSENRSWDNCHNIQYNMSYDVIFSFVDDKDRKILIVKKGKKKSNSIPVAGHHHLLF